MPAMDSGITAALLMGAFLLWPLLACIAIPLCWRPPVRSLPAYIGANVIFGYGAVFALGNLVDYIAQSHTNIGLLALFAPLIAPILSSYLLMVAVKIIRNNERSR